MGKDDAPKSLARYGRPCVAHLQSAHLLKTLSRLPRLCSCGSPGHKLNLPITTRHANWDCGNSLTILKVHQGSQVVLASLALPKSWAQHLTPAPLGQVPGTGEAPAKPALFCAPARYSASAPTLQAGGPRISLTCVCHTHTHTQHTPLRSLSGNCSTSTLQEPSELTELTGGRQRETDKKQLS